MLLEVYVDEEGGVVFVDEVGIDVGGGGSSSSNIAFSMDAGKALYDGE